MPIPEKGLGALELLEWFFAHEDEFPKDPVAILRHVGIVVAKHTGRTSENLYHEVHTHDTGSPIPSECWRPELDLAGDLRRATEDGKRNVVAFEPDSAVMNHPSWMQTQFRTGWSIYNVMRHRAVGPYPGDVPTDDLYTASYTHWDDGKTHTYWDGKPRFKRSMVVITARPRDEDEEGKLLRCCAKFKLRTTVIYWYLTEDKHFFCLAPDNGDGPVGPLHAVCALPYWVKYAVYDNNVAWRVVTDMHMCAQGFASRHASVMRFTDENKPFQYNDAHYYEGFDPDHAACPWPVTGLEFHEIVETWRVHFQSLQTLFWFTHDNWRDAVWRRAYPDGSEFRTLHRCGRFLSKQLHTRINRIVRQMLLAKAQALEEKRARDPVKRCAACAVQAAKDQIVLGLEPKRQKN